MTGKNSINRHLLEKDKEDAKKAREQNPEAFHLPKDLSFIKKENRDKVELILPEFLPYTGGIIKVKESLVGQKMLFNIAKKGNSKGKVELSKDDKENGQNIFDPKSLKQSEIGHLLYVEKKYFISI